MTTVTEFLNENAPESKKRVLIFCAHSDDQVFGAGATIPLLVTQGYEITTIILSHGESSHPWLKKGPLAKLRMQESEKAARILGIRRTIFLDMQEDKILDHYLEDAQVQTLMLDLMRTHLPERILTHSDEDSHPSHRQVHDVVKQTYHALKDQYPEFSAEVYLYDVWTIAHFKRRDRIWHYIDVSTTFPKKIKALKVFKTQKVALTTLWMSVYAKAILYGLASRSRLAERFLRVRW